VSPTITPAPPDCTSSPLVLPLTGCQMALTLTALHSTLQLPVNLAAINRPPKCTLIQDNTLAGRCNDQTQPRETVDFVCHSLHLHWQAVQTQLDAKSVTWLGTSLHQNSAPSILEAISSMPENLIPYPEQPTRHPPFDAIPHQHNPIHFSTS